MMTLAQLRKTIEDMKGVDPNTPVFLVTLDFECGVSLVGYDAEIKQVRVYSEEGGDTYPGDIF